MHRPHETPWWLDLIAIPAFYLGALGGFCFGRLFAESYGEDPVLAAMPGGSPDVVAPWTPTVWAVYGALFGLVVALVFRTVVKRALRRHQEHMTADGVGR